MPEKQRSVLPPLVVESLSWKQHLATMLRRQRFWDETTQAGENDLVVLEGQARLTTTHSSREDTPTAKRDCRNISRNGAARPVLTAQLGQGYRVSGALAFVAFSLYLILTVLWS
jgi:hypothetical protein